MIEAFGIKLSYEAVAFFVLFISSEVLGASKAKDNSLVQLIIRFANSVRPFRKEDDTLQKIKELLRDR